MFLGKPYDNLLTVEIFCHGVPNQLVWQHYLKDLSIDSACINNLTFRDKKEGWRKYHITASHNQGTYTIKYDQSPYMQAFIFGLSLRNSCYHCPAKSGSSGGDIMLADFWDIEHVAPGMDDDRGTSLVLLNTQKGASFFNTLKVKKQALRFDDAIKYNNTWWKKTERHPSRDAFFKNVKSGRPLHSFVGKLIWPVPIWKTISHKILSKFR